MSENIPESVPTSQDPRSKRPLKRRALSPTSKQASQVEALFANPDREIVVPDSSAVSRKTGLPAPPEIVANVQGSSAGAGSGEFHVYKASRRREYERLKMMDEENAREIADADFEKKKDENKAKDESKTEKNRKKREKQRQRKDKSKSSQGQDHERKEGAGKAVALNGHAKSRAMSPPSNAEESAQEVGVQEGIGVIIHDDD